MSRHVVLTKTEVTGVLDLRALKDLVLDAVPAARLAASPRIDIWVRVPGGGDYSGEDLDVGDPDAPSQTKVEFCVSWRSEET